MRIAIILLICAALFVLPADAGILKLLKKIAKAPVLYVRDVGFTWSHYRQYKSGYWGY